MGGLSGSPYGALDALEYRLGLLEQDASARRKTHPPRVSFEEEMAHLSLEVADLLRQRRRLDAQFARGGGEAAGPDGSLIHAGRSRQDMDPHSARRS